MKILFSEWPEGCEIYLTPETTKEVAELLRVAKNAKATKPILRLRFNKDEPHFSIYLEKVKPSVQENYIGNK